MLGPNGAGKSTLLQLATGQLFASQGQVRVLGQPVWNNPSLNRHIGLCPEQDAFYEWMTGWDFVYTSARLAGMSRPRPSDAAARTLESVGMTQHQDRADPRLLQRDAAADEAGPGPGARSARAVSRRAADRHRPGRPARSDEHHPAAGQRGKSVLVSSHVLHEVQSLTPNIILLNHGRLVAEGHVRQIRDLIDKHPHHIVLICDEYRKLAGRLLAWEDVEGVRVLAARAGADGRNAASPTRFTAACRHCRWKTAWRSRRSIPTTIRSKASSSTW